MEPALGHGTKGQAGPAPAVQGNVPSREAPVTGLEHWRRKTTGGNEFKEELARTKQELAEQKENRISQEKLDPFFKAEAADVKAQNQAAKIAEGMLNNLRKNKSKWPGAIKGSLASSSQLGQKIFLRDPDVRKYVADANSLVSALANTRRGQPTNFKLQLEALSKADLSQPIPTQEELLQDVINKRDATRDRQRFIESQKTKNGYPLDIERRVIEFEDAQDNPLDYPQYYKEGTNYQDDDGTIYVIKRGQWQEE